MADDIDRDYFVFHILPHLAHHASAASAPRCRAPGCRLRLVCCSCAVSAESALSFVYLILFFVAPGAATPPSPLPFRCLACVRVALYVHYESISWLTQGSVYQWNCSRILLLRDQVLGPALFQSFMIGMFLPDLLPEHAVAFFNRYRIHRSCCHPAAVQLRPTRGYPPSVRCVVSRAAVSLLLVKLSWVPDSSDLRPASKP